MADDNKLDINEAEMPFVSADEIVEIEVPGAELAEAVENEPAEEALGPLYLAREIENRFYEAERGRDGDESRWLTAYRNYRGVYGKDVRFRENEKSRVFVKVTKTKVLAAYGQLVDVVFSGNKFPIGVEETRIPEGVAEYAHFNPLKDKTGDVNTPAPNIEGSMIAGETTAPEEEVNPFDVGYMGDGKVLAPGVTFSTKEKFLGGLEEEYTNKEGEVILEAGKANTPEQIQISPAKIAARRMEKLIHDQIEESNGSVELRNALFESALLGTGVIKGPFNYNKTLHKWTVDEEGTRHYTPETVRVPRIEFVSLWDFYPDPNAKSMEDAEWVIQRHRYNKSQLRDLRNYPYFRREELEAAIKDGPNYNNKDFENDIQIDEDSLHTESDRYEVLEFWGVLDYDTLKNAGMRLDVSEEEEEVQVNIWVCNGRILRVVANPFTPARIPYLAFPYEKNPYSIFGIGVAENMEDSQQIMNGHARMAIDNLALSGSLVFDIDEAALEPGQSMEIYPGKIFKRQSGMPGQAIYAQKFPNTVTENMQMFDKFRQLADESTGMPSYSHGQTGIQSTTRTAAGMSMLMGAASLNIKTVVKNLDDFLLKKLGEAFFQWNMAFYEGELAIEGDLEVKANGTSSLIQKEVRSQRLTMLLQTVQNPAIAPLVKMPTLLRELAHSMDLDPDEFLNTPDEARLYAEIVGLQNQQPAGQVPPGQVGEIGAGAPPMPGEEGFSGNVTPPVPPQGGIPA